jgi:hypothetical protein
MQNKAIFSFHLDIHIFENKVARETCNLSGARLLWNALLMILHIFQSSITWEINHWNLML